MPIIYHAEVSAAPAVEATSADGVLHAKAIPASGGVLLTATYTGTVRPIRVRFFRDGKPVRSGDPAQAVSGRAQAFDMEVANGESPLWSCQPIYWNAGFDRADATGSPVSLVQPDITGEFSLWVKSLTDPNLSMRLRPNYPVPVRGFAGRSSLGAMPGALLPAGSYDVPTRKPEAWTIKTSTSMEYLALERLILAGTVLIQTSAAIELPDFYGIMTDYSSEAQLRAIDGDRLTTVEFQPVEAPPTVDSPLYVEGHSFGDLADNYATLGDVAAVFPTFGDLVK